ncbi:tRNA-specific adenosine deaminase [Pelagivirga sediminicola]|uniref:tRNA-specific adenosine deaminase n=1 Tax=Pelagivirga sediminicola TaxID=2170575 RepID=A0A2T7G5N4_9RHOB|nr:nucleoside deaminase [Pelagivirga sediminicola]PVA09734.1 tRNA-specific adenosine deaminase [Pelagivirga sediminicola]
MSREDHLNRCIALAEEALEAGDAPFGSVLVGADGSVLREARNRARTGDPTQHPEFELARWAAQNLSEEARAAATVYTSGEHCPMCSAAHGWAGLGPVVFIHSTDQLAGWMAELGVEKGPVAQLGIARIAPNVPVEGPIEELAGRMRALHARAHGRDGQGDGIR